jgi:transposase
VAFFFHAGPNSHAWRFATARSADPKHLVPRRVAGGRIILVWNPFPAYRGKLIQECLFEQRQCLTIEWLPGYAPDLNPTEGVWNSVMGREMANLSPVRMEEAVNRFRRSIQRVVLTCQPSFHS